MKSISVVIIGIFPFCSLGQNIDADSLCQTFNEQLSVSKNKSDSLRAYITVINRNLYQLIPEKKDSLESLLFETCPNAKTVSSYNKPLTVKKDDNSTESFKAQKATVNWQKRQIKDAIKVCQGHGLNKTICKDAVYEASKHINYEDFNELTDYQKGVVLAKAYDILEN